MRMLPYYSFSRDRGERCQGENNQMTEISYSSITLPLAMS
jgi:hypothetical protein